MKTDDLIERLGRESTVVAPLPAPGMRTAVWLICSALCLLVVVGFMFSVMSRGRPAMTPLYLAQLSAALATAVTAALAAFASVVPGVSDRVRVLPAISGAVWLTSLSWGCWHDLRTFGTLRMMDQTDWPCVVSIAIGGAVLSAPMFVMLRRGAPFTPATTGFLGGLAALSLANVEACLTRPHAFAMTILMWHGITIALMAVLFAWLGRRWLRWPTWSLR